jgi:hypothetical protein
MSSNWDREILLKLEPMVCFGGIHFEFRFMFALDGIVFGRGAYETLQGTAEIDNAHHRVVYRHLVRRGADGRVLETFPFLIVVETTGVPTQIEPWAPGSRGPFTFAPIKTAIFRTDTAGPGFLTIYLLDEFKFTGMEADFPFAFNKNSANTTYVIPRATVASTGATEHITLRVGDRRPLPMSLQVGRPDGLARVFDGPLPLSFASKDAFEAERNVNWNEVSLTTVVKKFTKRWGEVGYGPLPFSLRLDHASSGPPASDSPVRFYSIEDAVPGVNLNQVFSDAVSGEYNDPHKLLVRGRRPGTGTISTVATNFFWPDRFENSEIKCGSVSVTVTPAVLHLTAGPDPDGESLADGTIILEDFWDGEALRGSLSFSVEAPMPNADPSNTPPGPWPQYDSLKEAFLVGRVLPHALSIEEVYVLEEANVWEKGRKVRRSFRIELSIRDPSVVMFELPPEATVLASGTFEYYGPLKHILRAVGPGDTQVIIEIARPDEPISDDLVVYYMPIPKLLFIKVPEPLIVEFAQWSDNWFSGGPGQGAMINLALAPAEPPELIYNSGLLTGGARYHNPNSSSETIELLIDRPGQSRQTIDLLAYDAVNDDGTLSFNVTELRRLGNNGGNTLTLRAGKPINLVVNGAPDEESRILTGVLPIINTSAVFSTTSPVLRRNIGETSFRYSRAISAAISDEVESSQDGSISRMDLASVPEVAYLVKQVDVPNVTLPRIPGQHHVGIRAENQFGEMVDSGQIFIAPAPIATTNSNTWIVEPWNNPRVAYASGTHRLRIGNSNENIRADMVIQYALTVSREDAGTRRTIAEPAGYDPLIPSPFNIRVPRTGTLPQDAWTETTVRAENEFSVNSVLLGVHRRGDYYFWRGASLTINLVDNNIDLTMDVEVWLPDDTSFTNFDQGGFWSHSFADGRSPSGLPYERCEVKVFISLSDGTKEAAHSGVDLTNSGAAEGPNYEHLLALFSPPQDAVVSGSPTVERLEFPIDPDVHYYNPVRVREAGGTIWVSLITRFHVDAPFESL